MLWRCWTDGSMGQIVGVSQVSLLTVINHSAGNGIVCTPTSGLATPLCVCVCLSAARWPPHTESDDCESVCMAAMKKDSQQTDTRKQH